MKSKNRLAPIVLICLVPLVTAVILLSMVISAGAQSGEKANRQVVTNPETPKRLTGQARIQAATVHGPLSFEANRGQTDPSVRFLSRGPGYTLFLTSTQAVLAFQSFEPVAHSRSKPRLPKTSPPFRKVGKTEVIRVGFDGASAETPRIEPSEELPGRTNYFIGNKPANWHTDIPTYRRATFTDIYPGIDLVYYGSQGQLEFDFNVRPGVDPRLVQMRFEGAEHLEIGSQGELRIQGLTKEVRLRPPSIYQVVEGKKKQVSGRFELRGPKGVGFNVDEYDRQKPLVIDPVLTYSTFFGGTGNDWASGIALDSQNNIYITGSTTSTDFPIENGYPSVGNTNGTAFISKFDPTGTTLLYSSYFGGSGGDAGAGIAADSSGHAYITGWTASTDFPILNGFQASLGNSRGNAFIARFNTTLSGIDSLAYSTYLGGGGNSTVSYSADGGNGVATDQAGNVYVTGYTMSDSSATPFPTTTNAYQATLGSTLGNAFLTVANTNASGAASLVYSTYLGGGGSTNSGDFGYGVAVDSAGNAYIDGVTNSGSSSPFPTTATAFQSSLANPDGNGFVTELSITNSGQQALIYSTYFGGSSSSYGAGDFVQGITLDSTGKAYITGEAYSSDFPVTAGAFQTTNSPGGKAFVAKLDLSQSGQQSLLYSTFLGGSAWDEGYAIAVDPAGEAFIVGQTASSDFPTTADAFIATLPGGAAGYLSELNPSGTALLYSTYIGGSCSDVTSGIALDTNGNPVATGTACSADFPTTSSAYQPSLEGSANAILVKFVMLSPTVADISPSTGAPGTSVTITGTNFGSSQGDSTVTFGGISATTSSWNATTIVAAVPSGATTGDVVVTVAGAASGGVNFTVVPTPSISGISPNPASVGTQIVISGSSFGSNQDASTVTFNGVAATITTWSDTSITAVVPTGASSGNVFVTTAGGLSNSASFAFATPTISGILPNPAPLGAPVVISGSNFGFTQDASTVTFNGVAATVSGWSDTSITAVVPSGAITGNVFVTTAGGLSNGVNFAASPHISGISPNPASVGTQITLSGSNFGSSQGSSTIAFGSVQGIPTAWSDASITLPVPTTATTGNVFVTVGGLVSNPQMFAVSGTNTFAVNGSLITPRYFHTATLLESGKALIVGGIDSNGDYLASTELYDPVSGITTSGPPLNAARALHTATLLNNGMVLIVGGGGQSGTIASSELYDPVANTFVLTGSLNTARAAHTATLLSNGQVLVAAGSTSGLDASTASTSAEIYDYGTQQFTPTGSLTTARILHTATALNDGTVIIIGGLNNSATYMPAEVYSTDTGTFTPRVSPDSQRYGHTATLLNNGDVLVAGGLVSQPSSPYEALLYDPTTNRFRQTGNRNVAAGFSPAVLLNNGTVLFVGGLDFETNEGSDTAEIYDPSVGEFSFTGSPNFARFDSTLELLPDGTVFVAGGANQDSNGSSPVPNDERYAPLSLAPPGLLSISVSPANPSVETSLAQNLVATGTFSDNSTQTLASATWYSGDGSVANISNDLTNSGHAYGTAPGSTSISACTPPICGSSTLTISAPAPLAISAISPTSGGVGMTVRITGTNFGPSEAQSIVTFNGVTAPILSWTETAIAAVVPTSATTGNVVVNVGGGPSNGVNFTVLSTPEITSLSTSIGPPGGSVTINGANFGPTQSGSAVTFNGISAAVTSWSDGTLVVQVPTGAATGNVVVTVQGVASNAVPFSVLSITAISPPAAGVGSVVTITGTSFGSFQDGDSIIFNGIPVNPISWGSETIITLVPAGASTGPVLISVGSSLSNPFTFSIGPAISDYSPNKGPAGTQVTISGSGFGAVQGASAVTFNGIPAAISSWSDGTIVASVPASASTGPLQVISNGLSSNVVMFGVSPSLSSLSATGGPVGMVVQLYGSNFGASGNIFGAAPSGSSVTFNGVAAIPTFWRPNLIQTNVPTGATTGPIVVTVGGASSNSITFAVGVGSITGTVTRLSNGSSLSGAGVIAFQSAGAVAGTTTAGNGTYTIPNLNPGTYDLQFVYSGLETQTIRNLSVQVGSPLTVNESLGSGGTISGSVTKAGGGGISGAQINALEGPESAGGAITDGSGNFTIPNLGAGSYTVSASAEGFTPVQVNVAVTEGNTSTANFTLTGQSTITYTYDEVGRLVGVVDSLNGAATYTYDAVGNTTSIGRTSQGQISIISFSPKTGVAGTNVTISGNGFNVDPGSNTVTFNGTGATVASASATQIIVAVPSGASTGPISVSNSSGSATSSGSFTIGSILLSPTTLSSSDGQTVTATFSATAGSRATVHVTNDYLSTIIVQLLDPNNNVISSTYNYGTFDLPSANLSVTGSYTISVQPQSFLFSGPASGSVTVSATNP